jgi:putative sterol carrier protein
MSDVELFSQEWCEEAKKVWDAETYPYLVDSENYNYIAEWGVTENPDQVCQFRAEKGRLVEWDAGKKYSDEDSTFLIWAKKENWKKVAEGSLDPVGAVAAKRIHVRKGPMTVIVNEADAFTRLLKGYGSIPTQW